MNFNGNTSTLNHLIHVRRKPQLAGGAQLEFNKKRLEQILAMVTTRPHFIGLRFELPAEGSLNPVQEELPDIKHDVILTGAVTNSIRQLTINRENEVLPVVYTGNDYTVRLRLNELAGREIDGSGQAGIFYFPEPHVYKENSSEIYSVYKTETTDSPETAWLGLCGVRVYPDNYAEANLTQAQRGRAVEAINSRPAPETHVAKTKIVFNGGGRATFETPKIEEPHKLRGIKTTLKNSIVKMNIKGEAPLTSSNQNGFVPIWTIAAQPIDTKNLYAWQQRGLYLDSEERIEGEIINTLDYETADGDGEITWILETL